MMEIDHPMTAKISKHAARSVQVNTLQSRPICLIDCVVNENGRSAQGRLDVSRANPAQLAVSIDDHRCVRATSSVRDENIVIA